MDARFIQGSNMSGHTISPFLNPIQVILNGNRVFNRNVIDTSIPPPSFAAYPSVFNQSQPTVRSIPFSNPRYSNNLTYDQSWMTDSIRNALQEKNKLFRQAKETNDPALWKQYNNLKEKSNQDISQANSRPSYNAQKFRSNNSWMTDSIRNALQERNKLFHQAKETNDPALWKQYNILKEKINQDISQAKSKLSYNAKKYRSNNNNRLNKKEKELPFSCDTCDRSFATETELKAHIDLHVKCHYTGCNFEAHPKIITLHKRMQHDTGYAGVINKLQNDEDIEKWREERRKRFPTAENILKRKAEQTEKEARGEIVAKKDFGRLKKQKFDRKNWKENRFNRNKLNRLKSRHQHNNSRLKEGLSESEEECHIKLSRFSGIKTKDDNSTDTGAEGIEEAPIDIPNPEAPIKETNEGESAPQPEVQVLNDSNDETPMEISITKDPSGESSEELADDRSFDVQATEEGKENSIENQSTDMSVEDTCSGVKETEGTASNEKNNKSNAGSEKRNRVERYPGRKIQEREQNLKKISLLEMLLDNEVRHERNVIMQCVRHIVRNNFFGIGEDLKKQTSHFFQVLNH